jgi:hypothetical protein
MADSSITIKTAATDQPVSTRTNAAGEHMEAVVIGIDGSNSTVGSDATNGLDVDVTRVSGNVNTVPVGNATATLTNVSASASSVTILALNTNRRGAVVYNDSTATLYLKYGSTASDTSFTYLIPAATH